MGKEEWKKFDLNKLDKVYESECMVLEVEGEFVTPLMASIPAGEDGIRMYCIHHLGITDPDELEAAVRRIMKEEIGIKDADQNELDEIQEKNLYALNVLRRDHTGRPFIGDWMVKACMKATASCLDLFIQKKGLKKTLAELGRVEPIGKSCDSAGQVGHIYLYNGKGPVKTYYETIRGRVSSPKGAVSIIHDAEAAPVGTKFAFRFYAYPKAFNETTATRILGYMGNVGLGAARSLERGKFKIIDAKFKPGKMEKEPVKIK